MLIDGHKNETINKYVEDRKSTRLNSSHPSISYAVFCLKKKNTNVSSSELDHVEFALLVEALSVDGKDNVSFLQFGLLGSRVIQNADDIPLCVCILAKQQT